MTRFVDDQKPTDMIGSQRPKADAGSSKVHDFEMVHMPSIGLNGHCFLDSVRCFAAGGNPCSEV